MSIDSRVCEADSIGCRGKPVCDCVDPPPPPPPRDTWHCQNAGVPSRASVGRLPTLFRCAIIGTLRELARTPRGSGRRDCVPDSPVGPPWPFGSRFITSARCVASDGGKDRARLPATLPGTSTRVSARSLPGRLPSSKFVSSGASSSPSLLRLRFRPLPTGATLSAPRTANSSTTPVYSWPYWTPCTMPILNAILF